MYWRPGSVSIPEIQMGRSVRCSLSSLEHRPTHLCNRKLKVLLRHMLSSFSQSVHAWQPTSYQQPLATLLGNNEQPTRFCANPTDFSSRTLPHLLCECSQVNTTLERHLETISTPPLHPSKTYLSRMDAQNADTCFWTRRRELNLTVYAAGS